MKVRKIISILLAVTMVLSGVSAFAAGELLTEDYSTSSSGSKPANFSSWSPGGLSGTKASISVETNIYGESDACGAITWPAASSSSYKPYVRADISGVTTTNTLKLSFDAAAADKTSSKAVYLTDTRSAITTDSDVMLLFSTDGKIYSYGTKIADSYDTGKWYHFDIEVSGASCTVYIDGKTTETTTASGAVGATTYLYYGMYSKTGDADTVFYTDDFVLDYGTVSENSKTDVTSDVYTFGASLISGIGQGETVDGFLAGITSGNAQLSVVNSDGSAVSGNETLAVGMKLKITSADGKNTRYYNLDCLAASISCDINGGSTKLSTQDVTVAFNGTGTVDFYVNDTFYTTVTEAPYTATIEHTEEGTYTVYGVIHILGESQNTDTVSYTYAANVAPVVSLEGVSASGEYSSNDTFAVTVNATDSDGTVENIELYLDGVLQTSETNTYTFGPLSVGQHTVRAIATDDNGAEGDCEVRFVTATRSKSYLEDPIDFSGATGTFRVPSGVTGVAVANDDDSYGDYMKFTSNESGDGITYYQSSCSYAAIAEASQVYIECDVRLSNTQAQTWLMAVRQSGVAGYSLGGEISSGALGSVTIEPNKWYHYKTLIDIPNGVAKTWVWDEINEEYILASTGSACTTWNRIDFIFSRSNSTEPWEASLDNIEIYRMTEEPYFVSAEYFNADGDNVHANGKVGYDLSTIKLNFNNKLSTSLAQDPALLADCVSLSQNGVEISGFVVSVSDNALVITFDDAVNTLKDYTLTYQGIVDEFDNVIPSGTVNYTTGPAEYDVLDWTVKVNGTEVTSLSGITSGDTVGLSAEIINQAAGTQNSKLVAVLYSGNKCLGMTVTNISTNTTPSEVKDASDITVNGTIDDTLKLYAYIWSSLGSGRTVQIQSFYME